MNREYWEDIRVVKTEKVQLLRVIIGGEDPWEMLENEERTRKLAEQEAIEKGFPYFHRVEDEVRTYGQNELSERWYYFSKKHIK
ncbi:hypothetical protein [Aneurinibacillus aneurinilyticus]|uniref:Uncharacterized protein n=1 Tax=Aneurinibacillus aneurinilyticus TaxID=1391 RepID=A0A848D1R0_ANEAE|nr:hypothetical protein [Aneurinibacillus aneurinilyticus]NMF01389.1 hypothetical protein [Aneurinibacillus aneurinilyticus]